MKTDKYSRLAMRTATDLGMTNNLVHAALLLTSESGEVASEVKKFVAYGKPLNVGAVAEELGDLCWGINLMLNTIGFTWDDILTMNIAKLQARYPDGFDAERATVRDLAAEKAAMEAV